MNYLNFLSVLEYLNKTDHNVWYNIQRMLHNFPRSHPPKLRNSHNNYYLRRMRQYHYKMIAIKHYTLIMRILKLISI